MKSLLFITNEYPYKTGDSAFIRNEIPYVAKNFDKVHVLSLNVRKKCALWNTPDNVFIYRIKFKRIKKIFMLIPLLFDIDFYREIFFLLKKRKFSINSVFLVMSFLVGTILTEIYLKNILKKDKDICLIYTYWYWSGTMAASRLKKKYNIKCVTRTHRFDLYELKDVHYYQPFKLWMDKIINKVFFISKHGYDYYIKTFANSELKKYSLSYLGIINKYNIENKKGSQNMFTLLSCANLVSMKRIQLIIYALAEINELEIHWIHIGDGELKKNISLMADNFLYNKNNISYEFKGYMFNDEIMKYYYENHIDCFISVSESEGLPVSMMEAISFGIPIIATNVGGVSELVNGDSGILLNPEGNIQEIKRAIVDFYMLPENKKVAIRQATRSLWESNFNAEINYTKFSKELASICN